MNKIILLLALWLTTSVSAETLWIMRDSREVEYITKPKSYMVGQCRVTDYETTAGERHIFVSTEQDGVKDIFNFTAWMNRRGVQTRSFRLQIRNKDRVEGPYLIGNCPLYIAVTLPKEVQNLGCTPDPL